MTLVVLGMALLQPEVVLIHSVHGTAGRVFFFFNNQLYFRLA